MSVELLFRRYETTDQPACLSLFDANCPAYFAPNEREDYAHFLSCRSDLYQVCMLGERIVGAFGLYPSSEGGSALHWILLSPLAQGHGLGSIVMSRVISESRTNGCSIIHISASHKSAPFFAKFGAVELSTILDGWGPGMHRVEMRLAS